MNPTSPQLPAALGRLLSLLPVVPGSFLFANAVNLVLRGRLPADVLAALTGKVVRVRVTDAQLRFDVRCDGRQFSACRADVLADVTIAACARDFYLLMRRQEDPDTLFFSRRLAIEGDTELGLLIKNTLDALELPFFAQARG